jgi:hypothetical protein
MTVRGLASAAVMTIALPGCGDQCSSYSAFSCREIERAEYNVFFIFLRKLSSIWVKRAGSASVVLSPTITLRPRTSRPIIGATSVA